MKECKLEVKTADRASEIFQALDIKFAFCKKIAEDSYKQQHLAIKCRDFLGDCIWSKKTKNSASIYNFYYDYKKEPFDEDKLRLSLTFPDKESLDNFKDNLVSLNLKEESLSLESTIFHNTDKPLTIIVESDKTWQSCIWKLSLFTFYLKLASYKTLADLKNPENDYITYLTQDNEQKLLSHLSNNEEFVEDRISMAHNYSGFVSIIKKQNAQMHQQLLG